MQLITLLPTISLLSRAFAQGTAYTDSNDIEFWNTELSTDVATGDAQFGMVLPPADAADLTTEYIGRLVVPIPETGTWFGLTHKSGMTGNLILMAWPSGEDVVTDFRYATGYTSPARYTGNATLTQISSSVNETHFEIAYRCQDCWAWDHEGAEGNQIPGTEETSRQIMGWAQGASAPTDPEDAGSAITQHASANMFYVVASSARNAAYTDYSALAAPGSETEAPAPTATAGGNSTTSSLPEVSATGAACPSGGNMNANQTYDYIIVGSGAGGIPAAAKLAESGKKVLLIERGPASSGRHGGTMKPDWLSGTNLTRFDVPGLDNEIWVNSEGVACTDYSVMAGCVLGGGTAVNAGLWWNPDPLDFDEGFPEGWKHADIEPAIARAFEKIPYNERPSKDGELYKAQGYNIVGAYLLPESVLLRHADTFQLVHSRLPDGKMSPPVRSLLRRTEPTPTPTTCSPTVSVAVPWPLTLSRLRSSPTSRSWSTLQSTVSFAMALELQVLKSKLSSLAVSVVTLNSRPVATLSFRLVHSVLPRFSSALVLVLRTSSRL
jgi:cellobiose dehydrogenase (acceptor)